MVNTTGVSEVWKDFKHTGSVLTVDVLTIHEQIFMTTVHNNHNKNSSFTKVSQGRRVRLFVSPSANTAYPRILARISVVRTDIHDKICAIKDISTDIGRPIDIRGKIRAIKDNSTDIRRPTGILAMPLPVRI